MFSQLFGKYLVDKDVITPADYAELIKKQLSTRVKLGTIAEAEGMLTAKQVETIHHLQLQYDKRFGDLAVENGLLTDEQVGVLLKKQGNPYMQFLEVLLESGKITVPSMDAHLSAFQKERGFSDAEMTALKNDDIDALLPTFVFSSKPYICELAGLVLRNINRFVSRDFYFENIRHTNQLAYKHLSGQKTIGDSLVYLAIAQSGEGTGFAKVASGFAEEEVADGSIDAYDAVCEFINCNSGLFASEISKKGISLDMEPSVAYKDSQIMGQIYILPVIVEGQEIQIVIAVENEIELGDEPIKLAKEEGAFAAQSKTGDAGKGRILIVDDSRTSRKILRGLLEDNGYVVVGEAQDGEEAIDMYKELAPDLVTLDITMPKLDGIGALKAIKAIDDNVKAIMITAAGQQSKILEALKNGAEQFITKPFDKDEILKCLNNSLGK